MSAAIKVGNRTKSAKPRQTWELWSLFPAENPLRSTAARAPA